MGDRRAHISLFDLLNRLIWMFKFRLRATQFARGLRVWLIPFLRPAGHLRVPLASPAPPASPPRIMQPTLNPPRSWTVNFLHISSVRHTETPDTPLSISPLEPSHASPLIGEYYLRSATPDLLRMATSRLPDPPDATKRRLECKWRFGSRSSLNIIRGWHGEETEKIVKTAMEIMKTAVNL